MVVIVRQRSDGNQVDAMGGARSSGCTEEKESKKYEERHQCYRTGTSAPVRNLHSVEHAGGQGHLVGGAGTTLPGGDRFERHGRRRAVYPQRGRSLGKL